MASALMSSTGLFFPQFPPPAELDFFPCSEREVEQHIQSLPVKGAAMSETTAQSGLSDNAAGALAYITIIPAIIFLIVEPYNRNSYIRFHSWQSIFLGIAWVAVWMVLAVVGTIPVFNFIDIVLFPLVGLGFLILWVIALVNASQGKRFQIPVIGPLAVKQAGM
jgi:uncharacterized membrane protein